MSAVSEPPACMTQTGRLIAWPGRYRRSGSAREWKGPGAVAETAEGEWRELATLLGASSVRLSILQLVIRYGEVRATELEDALGLTRNGVGAHLKELTAAGFLIERNATHPRGAGNVKYWRVDRERIDRTLYELPGRLFGYGQSNSVG